MIQQGCITLFKCDSKGFYIVTKKVYFKNMLFYLSKKSWFLQKYTYGKMIPEVSSDMENWSICASQE